MGDYVWCYDRCMSAACPGKRHKSGLSFLCLFKQLRLRWPPSENNHTSRGSRSWQGAVHKHFNPFKISAFYVDTQKEFGYLVVGTYTYCEGVFWLDFMGGKTSVLLWIGTVLYATATIAGNSLLYMVEHTCHFSHVNTASLSPNEISMICFCQYTAERETKSYIFHQEIILLFTINSLRVLHHAPPTLVHLSSLKGSASGKINRA